MVHLEIGSFLFDPHSAQDPSYIIPLIPKACSKDKDNTQALIPLPHEQIISLFFTL